MAGAGTDSHLAISVSPIISTLPRPYLRPMVPRVLFVDDDRAILDGLRVALHRRRGEWDMVFTDGAVAALAQCAQQGFDVIVTDMRMPQVDGAALLSELQQTYPDAVRIVLTGHTEVEAGLRTVPTAHQYLVKPCGRDVLVGVIQRACQLRATLKNDRVRRLLGGIGGLPAAPLSHRRLTAALAQPGRPLADVAASIELDIALSAKVLQLANSSFIGLGRSMSSVSEATSYLGASMLRKAVHSFTGPDTPRVEAAREGGVVETLQRHSLHVARIARRLAASPRAAEDAFTAGILHEVGRLFLATHMPAEFAASLERAADNDEPLVTVEKAMFGASHAELGAYLLGIWGLPRSIVDAVGGHHTLDEPSPDMNDVSVLLRLAESLSKRTAPWSNLDPGARGGEFNADFELDRFDASAQWHEMAVNLGRELAQELQEQDD